MGNTTLDLLIQARADFGAAKSQLTGLHQFLQGLEQQSKGVGGLIDLKPDTIKNIEALNKALAKTGQAGKALSAIQFPEAKFRAAAAQVEAMRRNFEQLQKTDLGKLARDLAKAAGQDVTNPLSWQWNKMTRGMQMQDAMILRNAYRSALYQPGTGPAGGPHGGGPGGPGSPGGGRDWGAYGARFGSWLGSGIGGGLLRTGGAIGSLALGGGIMGAMFTGYRENQQMLEGVDAIFKSIGGNTGGFQALKEQVADLGGALQMTGAEASKLAETFVRTAGAADNDALARAQGAGQFGRGLGLDPNASAQLFGRAGLIGVGNSRQSQRDFATLMGKTIADSGMFARSEQVMEGMVGQLERIASTQGRTASTAEMQNFGTILGELLKNPALRGGGADSIMGVAQRLGGGGDLAMAMMAYGGLAGGDLGKVIEIANSDAMTPIGQLKGFEGSGITDTRADYMVRLVRNLSRGTGLDEGQFAAMQFGVNPELYRQYAGVFDGKNRLQGDGGFRSWIGGLGMNPDQVQMSGIGTLSDIYANQGAGAGSAHINRLVSQANEYRSNGQLKDRPELLRELEAAMGAEGGPQQLQAVMAKIAGQVGAPLTEADKTRQAQADLVNALGEVGSAVNKLVPVIKDGLTPAIETAAELLNDVLDFFTPDTEAQKAAKEQVSRDDRTLQNWREQGWLDDNYQMTDQFGADPWAREQYQRIARERGLGSTPPPAGAASAPSTSSPPPVPTNPTWNVAPPTAPNSGVTGGAAAATGTAPAVSGDGNYDLGSQEWRDYLGGLDTQYGFAPGTMMSLAQQESSNRALGYHYPEGPDGKRRARNGRVSTASGIFGILNSTASDPGYGVTPLPGPAYQQSHAAQAQFAAEYLAARTNAAGGQLAGLAAYGEGTAYANQVAGRAAASAADQAPPAPVAVQPALSSTSAQIGRAPIGTTTGTRVNGINGSSDWSDAAQMKGVDGKGNVVGSGRRTQVGEYDGIRDFGINGPVNPAPPPTPEPVSSMTTPKSADARVDGAVAININVAKDGKPVSETFRSLSFGEPRVPGSGGTLPKNNRVEWSHTV